MLVVAKLLYSCKRTRSDILTEVSFLTKRLLASQRADLYKLESTVKYIQGTRPLPLILEVADPVHVTTYIDASYGVHIDSKSHTGYIITFGKGTIYSKSSTQKLNTISSTEAELVAVTEGAFQVFWTRNFLIEQGYRMQPAAMFQDNMSTIQLLKNGKSNAERTRHTDLRYFFITDSIKRGELQVIYKPTEEMIADIMTRALPSKLFKILRDLLLNIP